MQVCSDKSGPRGAHQIHPTEPHINIDGGGADDLKASRPIRLSPAKATEAFGGTQQAHLSNSNIAKPRHLSQGLRHSIDCVLLHRPVS